MQTKSSIRVKRLVRGRRPLASSCLSARPPIHPPVRLSAYIRAAAIGRIFLKFDTAEFYENLSRLQNFVKIGQNYRTLYLETWCVTSCWQRRVWHTNTKGPQCCVFTVTRLRERAKMIPYTNFAYLVNLTF
jgi:hypothetical protein